MPLARSCSGRSSLSLKYGSHTTTTTTNNNNNNTNNTNNTNTNTTTTVREKHCDFLVKWFPGYYSFKAVFVVAMCFPKLKVSHSSSSLSSLSSSSSVDAFSILQLPSTLYREDNNPVGA